MMERVLSEGLSRRMAVVHLTSVHPPLDVRIFHRECRTLAGSHYDVTVVAPAAEGCSVDGVRICAVPVPRSRLRRLLLTGWSLLRMALREPADLFHFHDPELVPVGILLKLYGRKVIYDVHESLPRQILTKYYLPRFARPVLSKVAALMNWFAGRFFDAIVCATPKIADEFPTVKTTVVHNFPLLADLEGVPAVDFQLRSRTIVYAGGLSENQGIRELVEAIALVPEDLTPRAVIAGEWSPTGLADEIMAMQGWGRVTFLGWQPQREIFRILKKSRIGVVVDRPIPNYIEGYSTKMFEYMAAAVPIVVSNFPLWQKIVDKAACGLLVNPCEPQEIAAAIRWLLENPAEAERMGHNGREAVRRFYNWEGEGLKLLELYHRLTSGAFGGCEIGA